MHQLYPIIVSFRLTMMGLPRLGCWWEVYYHVLPPFGPQTCLLCTKVCDVYSFFWYIIYCSGFVGSPNLLKNIQHHGTVWALTSRRSLHRLPWRALLLLPAMRFSQVLYNSRAKWAIFCESNPMCGVHNCWPLQSKPPGSVKVTVEFSSSSAAAVLSEVPLVMAIWRPSVVYLSILIHHPTLMSQDDQLAITLDDLAYRSLLLGFGFLTAPQNEFLSIDQTVKTNETQQTLHPTKQNLPRTIGIVSGAVWANEAWGNYWSWDPKERHSEVTQEWHWRLVAC